jgi:hypothetical protein
VVCVTGVDAIGAELSGGAVHRPELVAARFGVSPEAVVDAPLAARVILEDHLSRVPPGAAITIFLSRVSTAGRGRDAADLASRLAADPRVGRIVIGDLHPQRLEELRIWSRPGLGSTGS